MAWYLSNDRMKDAHYNPYRTMSTHLSQYTKSCLFYTLSYLCHHTTPICHHTVLSITLPEEHLKRHSFHSPLKLSTLKFSCGPSTTLNITRYTITKLINFCRTINARSCTLLAPRYHIQCVLFWVSSTYSLLLSFPTQKWCRQ